MLVNKTVEFFLSEVVELGRRSAVSGGGLGATYRRGLRLGRQRTDAGLAAEPLGTG